MDTSQHFSDHHTTISSFAKFSNSGIHRSDLSNVTQSHNLMKHLQPATTPATTPAMTPATSPATSPATTPAMTPATTPAPPSRRQVTFHLDGRALQLLFPGLILNSPADRDPAQRSVFAVETALACVTVFLLAVSFEGLKAGREVLLRGRRAGPGPDGSVQTEMQQLAGQQMFSLCHLLQATLHITQVVLSYVLMLLFMSYNGYLCAALAAGAGLGFFLFGRKAAALLGVPAHRR